MGKLARITALAHSTAAGADEMECVAGHAQRFRNAGRGPFRRGAGGLRLEPVCPRRGGLQPRLESRGRQPARPAAYRQPHSPAHRNLQLVAEQRYDDNFRRRGQPQVRHSLGFERARRAHGAIVVDGFGLPQGGVCHPLSPSSRGGLSRYTRLQLRRYRLQLSLPLRWFHQYPAGRVWP